MSKEKKARFGKLAFGDEERLTAGYAHHRTPAWSRDGKHLVFAVGQHDDSAWVVADRHGRVARMLEGPADGAAAFGPDGSLAIGRRFGATCEIWLTPGSDLPAVRLLGGDGSLYRDPALSPDGATLACATASDPEGATHLVLVSLQSGARVPITVDPQRADRHPCFTPDGTELCFEGQGQETTAGDHAIYVVHLQRNTVTRLTAPDERARRPCVIDERLVVYERHGDDGRVQLCLLDRGEGQGELRTQVIADDEVVRAEAACFVGEGGKVRVAFAAQHPSEKGEPPRFDVYVARLRGVKGDPS